MSKPSYLSTNIFLDSGNPDDTDEALALLGFLDGQTTNPTLVMKNPHIEELKAEGRINVDTIWNDYRDVALEIHKIIPDGSISAEVYADESTSVEEMQEQARMLSRWFPGIFVKLPSTRTGLEVAHILSGEGINVNMTLCFSEEQAAAVHMATRGAKKGSVYVSPFIGRLDDIGEHGLDLIDNIQKLYRAWDSHVSILAASIRSTDHLFACITKKVDIITVPLAILKEWKGAGLETDRSDFVVPPSPLAPILYEELRQEDFRSYDVHHDLTDKGLKKFAADWHNLLSK